MKTLLLSLLLATSAFAGDMKLNLVSAEQVSQWQKDTQTKTYIFDANNKDTRTKEGVVPGAMLLPSHTQKDVVKALPAKNANPRLVFYCANEQCMASHAAAEHAIKAGYSSVYVMSDGIMGWNKKGFKAQKFN